MNAPECFASEVGNDRHVKTCLCGCELIRLRDPNTYVGGHRLSTRWSYVLVFGHPIFKVNLEGYPL